MKYNNVNSWQVTWNTLGVCICVSLLCLRLTLYPHGCKSCGATNHYREMLMGTVNLIQMRVCEVTRPDLRGPGGVNGRCRRADCKCSHLESGLLFGASTEVWTVGSRGPAALIRPAGPWSWPSVSVHLSCCLKGQGQTDICIRVNVTT